MVVSICLNRDFIKNPFKIYLTFFVSDVRTFDLQERKYKKRSLEAINTFYNVVKKKVNIQSG